MPIPDEAILGTAIIIAVMQADPEVIALKRQIADLEAKVKSLPHLPMTCWRVAAHDAEVAVTEGGRRHRPSSGGKISVDGGP